DWCPDEVPPTAVAGNDVEVRFGESVTLDSCESSDDRAIAWIYWDVGADGTTDGAGCAFEFHPTEPGLFLVELVVVDSWGNRDTDTVNVRVRTVDDGPLPGLDGVLSGSLGPLALLGAFAAALALFLWRGRRRGPHKLNQPRAD
ncbi:MAG: PKD domain-containing protein, partial [Thermoplasmata archaeon]|nr:PKD domain-containing protein [Thermoplasmata archaeon]